MKKALLFNHHPDYFWQLQKTLENLGIQVYTATRDFTLRCGADYCSIHDGCLLQISDHLFEEEFLFGEKMLDYKDDLEDIDYVFTMNRDIAAKLDFPPNRLFLMVCVHWDLEQLNDLSKYRKVTSHPDAHMWNAEFLPYFCPQNGEQTDKTFMTQIIGGFWQVPWFDELIHLKNSGYPVIIGGSKDAPDGFVNDWEVLKHTSMLLHWKDYGTNCNSVMKSLDAGVPVYISRDNKRKLGMGDLPDDLFIFSDEYSILDAFEMSKNVDNENIQSTFRSIRNIELTSEVLSSIINKGNI